MVNYILFFNKVSIFMVETPNLVLVLISTFISRGKTLSIKDTMLQNVY